MIPQLIILDISTPPSPIKSSLNSNSSNSNKDSNQKPMVRFSKVMIVNNKKTVYLMKVNQSPGTTKNNVNRRFIAAANSNVNQPQAQQETR
jgi:hypothetical protein